MSKSETAKDYMVVLGVISGFLAMFYPTEALGKSVATFSVAVNRKHGEKEADFFDCEAWNGTADIVSRYLHKGSEVAINGSMYSDQYEAKDGTKRRTWRLNVEEIEFCGKAPEN